MDIFEASNHLQDARPLPDGTDAHSEGQEYKLTEANLRRLDSQNGPLTFRAPYHEGRGPSAVEFTDKDLVNLSDVVSDEDCSMICMPPSTRDSEWEEMPNEDEGEREGESNGDTGGGGTEQRRRQGIIQAMAEYAQLLWGVGEGFARVTV